MMFAGWTLLTLCVWAAEPPVSATADETFEPELPGGPDRSRPPEVAPPVVLRHPEPEVHRVSDGVEVWLVRVPLARKVEITVSPGAGLVEAGAHPTYTRAVGWLADAATADLDSAALSSFEDVYDIDLSSGIDNHSGAVAVSTPREQLDRALGLLADALAGPAYAKRDLQQYVRDLERYYGVQGPADPDSVARALMAGGWYPPESVYGVRPDLTQLDALSTARLAASYRTWLRSAPITVLVVGDVGWDELAAPITAMVDGLGAAGARAKVQPVRPLTAVNVLAAHVAGQEQVGIQVRLAGPASSGDVVAAIAGNFILGGHFLSRLNANLREDKGWTYGARSRFGVDPHGGMLTVGVDVKVENLTGAVREIEAELQRLVDAPVTDEELLLTFRSTTADHNRVMLNAASADGWYYSLLDQQLTVEAANARQEALGALTADRVQAVAAQYWAAGSPRLWTFVGDRARIEPQLAALGLAATWVDPADAILGKVPAAR